MARKTEPEVITIDPDVLAQKVAEYKELHPEFTLSAAQPKNKAELAVQWDKAYAKAITEHKPAPITTLDEAKSLVEGMTDGDEDEHECSEHSCNTCGECEVCEDCSCEVCDHANCHIVGCSACGTCDTKIEAGYLHCKNCQDHVHPYYGWCGEFDFCQSCCSNDGHFSCESCCEHKDGGYHAGDGMCTSCYEDEGDEVSYGESCGSMGSSTTPPWEQRGVTVEDFTIDGTHVDELDYTEVWGFQPLDHDPAQAMAEFYLLEDIIAMVNLPYPARPDGWAQMLLAEARTMQDAIVKRLDPVFTAYVDMAVGGELRHHKAMRGRSRQARDKGWNAWKVWRDAGGPDILIDAAMLSREVDGGSYLGDKWAVPAELLHARLTGKLSPKIWVDRVFSLQHNGGNLLNKVNWARNNDVGFGPEYMSSILGPAHAANPPLYSPLLLVAGTEVRDLFSAWWQHANRLRRDAFMPATRQPRASDDMDTSNLNSGQVSWRRTGIIHVEGAENYETQLIAATGYKKKVRRRLGLDLFDPRLGQEPFTFFQDFDMKQWLVENWPDQHPDYYLWPDKGQSGQTEAHVALFLVACAAFEPKLVAHIFKGVHPRYWMRHAARTLGQDHPGVQAVVKWHMDNGSFYLCQLLNLDTTEMGFTHGWVDRWTEAGSPRHKSLSPTMFYGARFHPDCGCPSCVAWKPLYDWMPKQPWFAPPPPKKGKTKIKETV